MMKIFSRLRCRGLIHRKFETIFTRKQYKSEEEEAKEEGRSAEAEEGEAEEGETEEEEEEEEEEEGNKARCFKEELPYDIMQVILQRLPRQII
ncbi:hypothetical protein ACLB2K_001397 [Fragaria x ananassa]